MKQFIYYVPQGGPTPFQLTPGDDFILLTPDTWDDFGYKTTFKTYARLNGKYPTLGTIQILFEDQESSSSYLNKLLADRKFIQFPLSSSNYISSPETLAFYEQIIKVAGLETARTVARELRDASYTTLGLLDEDALRLIRSEGFRVSLQRERGAQRAFELGWELLGGKEELGIDQVEFAGKSIEDAPLDLILNFQSDKLLPHDINVLIGPNGTGKSQLLIQMIDSWKMLPDEKTQPLTGFKQRPRFSQIVAVSYSPFERFPLDEGAVKRRDEHIYRYFGLRSANTDPNGAPQETLSTSNAERNAVNSFLECVADDQKFAYIREWSQKASDVLDVLGKAIDFDTVAVAVSDDADMSTFGRKSGGAIIELPSAVDPQHFGHSTPRHRWYAINPEWTFDLDVEGLRERLVADAGIRLVKNGKLLKLSSGQRLFLYMVVNVLGAMRRGCLVIIDEPELFLHPTLEIDFINLLKRVLSKYASKALIATHSAVIVREVPQDCVHVLRRSRDIGIELVTPPFQTFAGDIQRISSYVFDDRTARKGYEMWIKESLKDFSSAEALIKALGPDVNEELILKIRSAKG